MPSTQHLRPWDGKLLLLPDFAENRQNAEVMPRVAGYARSESGCFLWPERIDQIDPTIGEVCGVARCQREAMDERRGGNQHIGGMADDPLGGKLSTQSAAAASDGRRDRQDEALVLKEIVEPLALKGK